MPCKAIEGMAVHLSFDQNVVPYITANIYQIEQIDGIYYLRAIDEFCLPNPKNKTEILCREIIDVYGGLMASGGMYYYGDASGKHRDTRGMENDYDIVERVLQRFISGNSNRVATILREYLEGEDKKEGGKGEALNIPAAKLIKLLQSAKNEAVQLKAIQEAFERLEGKVDENINLNQIEIPKITINFRDAD